MKGCAEEKQSYNTNKREMEIVPHESERGMDIPNIPKLTLSPFRTHY